MKKRPADSTAPVTPLERQYADAIEATVRLVNDRLAAVAAKPQLTSVDGNLVNLFAQTLAALQKGPIWSARTIRSREARDAKR